MDGQICGTKCLIPEGKRQASFSHTLRSVVHEVNTEMRPLFLPAGGCFEEVKNNGNKNCHHNKWANWLLTRGGPLLKVSTVRI